MLFLGEESAVFNLNLTGIAPAAVTGTRHQATAARCWVAHLPAAADGGGGADTAGLRVPLRAPALGTQLWVAMLQSWCVAWQRVLPPAYVWQVHMGCGKSRDAHMPGHV